MSNAKKSLEKDRQVIEKLGLNAEIDESKHLKLIISNNEKKRCITTSKSPRSGASRKKHIALTRRVLREDFGLQTKSSDFLIEYVRFIKD